MKRIVLLTGSLFFCGSLLSQILYSNSLGNLSLQSYTTGNTVTQYTTVPNTLSLINDPFTNNAGTLNNPNAPFEVPALSTTGWAVKYNTNVNDTFLVSTSWLVSTDVNVDRWVMTGPVTITSAKTVLTWLAMSPDASYPDGYEVYATNKTGNLTSADFFIGDQLFALPDGNTGGGGEKNVWTRRSVSLNLINYIGQTLRFAFRDNSKNMYQLWIDDIEVKTLANSLDMEATSLETEKYFLKDSAQTLKVNVTNKGSDNITDITLNYQYGNSSIETQTFAFSSPLAYLQTGQFQFGLNYSFSTPGYYLVKSWVSSVNGVTDQNNLNDTAKFYVTVQASAPQKNVLIEQFVSANNGEGPDAQDKIQQFAYATNTIIAVNIHDGDSLKEPNSIGALNTYKKNDATAMVDRFYFSDLGTNAVTRPFYPGRVDGRLKKVVPVAVSIISKSYDSGTKLLSFAVKADFLGEVHGDYRINAYLIENQVCGKASDSTVNGYNQLSNYFNVPSSQYYQTGYYSQPQNAWVLDAWHYKHQNTLVYSFDGSFGISGLIPLTGVLPGQSFSKTYTLTVPTLTNGVFKFNADNIYIVAFAAEYSADINQRTVLNCTKDKLTANSEVVGLKERTGNISFGIYPNPSEGILYLNNVNGLSDYEVKVYNLLGNCVSTKTILGGNTVQTLDLTELSNGIYIIEMRSGNGSFKEKLIIQGR